MSDQNAPSAAITYRELRAAFSALHILALPGVRLPMQGVLRLKRLRRWAKAHMEDLEAVRQGILDEYALTDEDGTRVVYEEEGTERIRIDPAKGGEDAFNARWDEALDSKLDLPAQLWPSDFGEPARDWDWDRLPNVSVTTLIEQLGPLLHDEAGA